MERNVPKAELGFILWRASFALFPNEKVGRKAVRTFEKYFSGYLWAIDQTGLIVNKDCPDLSLLQFTIDLDDPNTVNSVNLLPQVIDRSINQRQSESFQIEIFENKSGGYTDSIVLGERGQFVLADIARNYNGVTRNLPALLAEIKNDGF